MNKFIIITTVCALVLIDRAHAQTTTLTTGTSSAPTKQMSETEIRRDAALKIQIVNLEHQIGVIEATIKRFEELLRRPKATKTMKDEYKAHIIQQEGLLEEDKKKVEILKREVRELEGLPAPTSPPARTPPPLGHLMDAPEKKQ